jgi:hypothetical protein
VLVAEIVAHFLPRLVDIHNYSGAQGKQGKLYNWVTLNTKVLKRLGFTVARPECERIANAEPGASCSYNALHNCGVLTAEHPGAIEQVLLQLQACLEKTAPAGAPIAAMPAGGGDSSIGHTPPVRESATQPQTAPRLGGGASMASELAARDAVIAQLQAANALLEQKVVKLEQLLRLRDAKVAAMLTRLGVDPTETK